MKADAPEGSRPLRSRTVLDLTPRPSRTAGLANGLIGVAIFSGSLPATRAAVGGFDPIFVTFARAAIAGLAAALALTLLRERLPRREDLVSLAFVSFGAAIGFPLLTALALQWTTAAHSLVFMGLLPLTTAAFGVLRGGERPRPGFWVFSALGAATVVGYASIHSSAGTLRSDVLMIAAVILCGLGYAEGAVLSRRLGGWQVISWALVLSLPLTLPIALLSTPQVWPKAPGPWIGLAYVALFSMWIGFIFWYRGLAQGGIAAVGQLQLLQPFLGLLLAAAFLHEPIGPSIILANLIVIGCVAGARRAAI